MRIKTFVKTVFLFLVNKKNGVFSVLYMRSKYFAYIVKM